MEQQKIVELVEKAIHNHKDLFLVDVKVKGNVENPKVLVLIDSDNGLSIHQCGKVSKQIGSELEQEEIMLGKYTLEVSSPGLDHPLSLFRQYKKNVGRILKIETKEGNKIEGKLIEAKNEMIILEIEKENKSLCFEEIKQTKIKILFK